MQSVLDSKIESEFLLIEAREWAISHNRLFEQILSEEHLIEQKKLNSLTRSRDIHSNPYCYIWMRNFPREELSNFKIRVISVTNLHTNEDIGHSCFELEDVIVDPTFGQFLNLDKAIKDHPESFIGKTLVETIENIEVKFGLRFYK